MALNPTQQNSYDRMLQRFTEMGLASLAPEILKMVQNSLSDDSMALALAETPAYKLRFSANEARRKAGLRVLSPAEYLSLESGYRQVMQTAGLPSGFYDQAADFEGFIATDWSVNEVNDRVAEHVRAAKNTDPGYRAMIAAEWGIQSDGDIAAFTLDPKRALPLLQRQVDAIGIADAARRQALTYSKERATHLAELGVTADQAAQTYGQIAEAAAAERRAAAATGLDYSQTDAEDELLTGLDSAKRKRQKVEGAFGAYNPQSDSTKSRTALSRESSASY